MSEPADALKNTSEAHTERGMAFLQAIRECETVASAAAKGGLGVTQFWNLRQQDPEFAAAYESAKAQGKHARAVELSAVLYEGAGKAAEDPRYTTQLIFALKNLAPREFRDAHDVNVNNAGDLASRLVNMDPAQAYTVGATLGHTPDQIDAMIGAANNKGGGDDA